MRRPTLRPGDGVPLLAIDRRRLRGGYRRSLVHCPRHAGCGKDCKKAKWHYLCTVHAGRDIPELPEPEAVKWDGDKKRYNREYMRLYRKTKRGRITIQKQQFKPHEIESYVESVAGFIDRKEMAAPSDHRGGDVMRPVANTRKPDADEQSSL